MLDRALKQNPCHVDVCVWKLQQIIDEIDVTRDNGSVQHLQRRTTTTTTESNQIHSNLNLNLQSKLYAEKHNVFGRLVSSCHFDN